MEKKAKIFYNENEAGVLTKNDSGYSFIYAKDYFLNDKMPAIALSFPKTEMKYESNLLFPFFFGLLAEGFNKDLQCRILKIDENDNFTRLIKTASTDTIGAITVKET